MGHEFMILCHFQNLLDLVVISFGYAVSMFISEIDSYFFPINLIFHFDTGVTFASTRARRIPSSSWV